MIFLQHVSRYGNDISYLVENLFLIFLPNFKDSLIYFPGTKPHEFIPQKKLHPPDLTRQFTTERSHDWSSIHAQGKVFCKRSKETDWLTDLSWYPTAWWICGLFQHIKQELLGTWGLGEKPSDHIYADSMPWKVIERASKDYRYPKIPPMLIFVCTVHLDSTHIKNGGCSLFPLQFCSGQRTCDSWVHSLEVGVAGEKLCMGKCWLIVRAELSY